MLTFTDFLRRNASSYGGRIAITSETGMDITYQDLEDTTNALANALVGAGLGPGDRLVWIDRNSADFLITYFATAKIGMTFTPLNAWLRPAELRPQLELIQPSIIVVGGDFVDLAEQALPSAGKARQFVRDDTTHSGWESWRTFAATGDTRPPDVDGVNEETVHEIVFTSGTTGQAKGVVRSQRARILDSVLAALGYQLNRDDHLLAVLPQFHIGGAAVPNQLLMQGGRVTILRRYEPEAVAHALKDGVTYIVGVPAHYALLFESGHLSGLDTTSVRGCYVGGSAATQQLFSEIQRHFPAAELVHGYGSTESGPHSMALRGAAFLSHFGSLGLPVAGTEVRVVDPMDHPVGIDEVGELQVRSDSVMTGYLDQPELTASAFTQDGWLRTGDLVRRADDGYFWLVDRAKDMIITGGENVYPREVEDTIASFPGVGEVAVVGMPDPLYEERVVALVRRTENAPSFTPDDLIAYVRERLAGFKTPKEVWLVDDLPRTETGKISKVRIRENLQREMGGRG
jgi:fatty-acyl-CoA synthase